MDNINWGVSGTNKSHALANCATEADWVDYELTSKFKLNEAQGLYFPCPGGQIILLILTDTE